MVDSISFKSMQKSRADYGSQFEILVSVLYNQIVKPGDLVVDGGANAGLHAFPLGTLVGAKGLVIAFEPIPEIFEDLKKNVSRLAVELHQTALSNKVDKLTFIVDKVAALTHIRHKYDTSEASVREITVKSETLDDVVGRRNVRFIKLDLEGNDFLALLGASVLLNRDRPPVIFENSRAWAAKCYGYTCEEFFAFFEKLRYHVFDLHGQPLTRENWDLPDLAFEYIAVPGEAIEQNQCLLDMITFFWREAHKRPLLNDWTQCVFACRGASDYMTKYHGPEWVLRAVSQAEMASVVDLEQNPSNLNRKGFPGAG